MNDFSLLRMAKRAGKAPGVLEYTGDHKVETKIHFIQYNEEHFYESQNLDVEEVISKCQKGYVSWVDVVGLATESVIARLAEANQMHVMLQEDLINTEQLPKFEDFGKHQLLNLKMLMLNDKKQIVQEHISLIITEHFIFSFQERPGDVFSSIRKRIRDSTGNIRKRPADYLFCQLLDAVVDGYFEIFENIRLHIEKLELRLFNEKRLDLSTEIVAIRKEIIQLRRWVMPLREALFKLRKMETEQELISIERTHFLQDISDQLEHVIQFFDSFREMVSYLMDLNFANLSNQTNETVKSLTVITGVFIPLSFIASVYGMNFPHMPEFTYQYSYYVVLGVMFILFITLLFAARRRGWW